MSDGPKIVVEKSTVPVRTADAVRRVLACNEKNLEFQVFVAPTFSPLIVLFLLICKCLKMSDVLLFFVK